MTRTGRRRFPILLAAIAALLVFIAVDAASAPVQAQTPAAELTGLSLSSGTLRPAFDPAVTEYRAAVKHSVRQITVAGTAATGVTVTYNDASGATLADANDSTPGHQVNLQLGETVFQVAAASGSDTETYTVTMERDASAFLGWTPSRDIDLDAANTDAVGMWSDGTTLWVADSADAKLYAYTLATRARDSSKDIDLHADNANPTGIWSDGTTLWVADDTDDKLYAYTLSTEARDDTRDITLDVVPDDDDDENDNPSALWGNTTHIYVAENEENDDTVYAYTIDTGASGGDRASEKDIDAREWNGYTTAIWSNGTTLWAAEGDFSVVVAYSLETGRYAGKEFDLRSSGSDPEGSSAMWSDGTTVWFKENFADGKLYSYNLPSVAGDTTLNALSITYGSSGTDAALRPGFAVNEVSYEVAVPSSAGRVTIAATKSNSSSDLEFLGSDGRTLADAGTASGHQVDIGVGYTRIFLKVTSSSGDALTYVVGIGRDSPLIHGWTPTKDINGLFADDVVSPDGMWSNGTTIWVGSNKRKNLYAYTLATGARDSGKDISLDELSITGVNSLWGDTTTIWVAGHGESHLRAYTLATGVRDSNKDIPFDAENRSRTGLWSNGTTLWVVDFHDNKVYAYAISDGARQASKDFNLGLRSANIGDIWSDGETMWAVDERRGSPLTAYMLDLNTDGTPGDDFGERDPAKDIPMGLSSPQSLWSDGRTIWVANRHPHKVYSFNMAPKDEGATALTGLAVTYGDGTDAALRPAFSFDHGVYRAAVPNSAGQATVTPTKHTAASTVSYLDVNGNDIPDADGTAAGQQVGARVGQTPVLVQVTSGTDSLTYALTVERDSAEDWGWTPTRDYNYLTAGNNRIRGMWSNADTLYVSHLLDSKIYAYNKADGSRDSAKDITLPTVEGSAEVLNQHSRGLWSDGTTLWVVDQVDEILYAYTLSTADRDTEKEIDLSFPSREGAIDVWSDGTTIWVSDTFGAILYAYKMDLNADGTLGADFGARDEDKDITLVSANNAPTGIWSDGETMWVADWFGQRAYAYALEDGARKADQEFELGAGPRALWADGVTMWAMTNAGKKIYSYRMPLSANASLKSLSLSDITLSPEFSAATTSYTTDDAELASSVTSTTVTAETRNDNATAVIKINGVEDADGTVDLVPGYNVITVVVTAQDGTTTQTYTVTVLRAAEDTSTSTDDTITSLLSRLDVKAVDGASNQIAGYIASNSQGSLSPAGFNYPAGFGRWYTVEALAVTQGKAANSAPTSVAISVRGTVTSVASSGTHRAHVLPTGADIDLRLDTDEFNRTYSLESPNERTVTKCFDVDEDGNESPRDCRVGETATETYQWITNPPPRLADGEKVIVRLRYSAPRPGTPGRPLVTAPEGKSGALVVNWIAPGSDDPKVRGYEVHVSPAHSSSGGVTRTTGGSTTRLPVLLLEPDTVYDVRVRARSGLATGPWSDTVRATTRPLQGTNSVSVALDLDGVTKVKVGDKLYKRLKVTGMNNLHADAFPEWFEGYYQGNFVEFRVLGGIHDSYEYEDLTHGYGEGAFYAGALTIGEDGEVYHNFGYEVIAEGRAEGEKGTGAPEYGPLYLWLERTTGGVQIGSTANSRDTALCVEIADDSNVVPTGRECPSMDGSPEESPGHAVQRITARFNDVPRSHDGESEFNFRLAFVKDMGISPTSLREDALAATGGAVTRVQRVDDRSDLFEITMEPDSDEDVTITLSSSGDCGESGAVCTQEEDPRKLYNSPTATVAGPILTASFQGLPSQHDGETAFSFRIAFNDEIATEEAEFRDHSVEVWGGEVTRAEPVGQRLDLWEVEVEPASDDSVMVSLKPTWSCAATGAVCTAGGRLLSVIPATMVPGPATWPVQVTGVAQVGKTLTADSSNLSERYGVQVTSMTYRWLANGARVPGANAQTYRPGDGKQGKKISVMATYTDDRGNEDTVISAPTEPLAARDRIRRATGLPVISGRALVGHTLTADKSLIIDANGLENAVFYYFWEADDESIPGATGTTYTPVAADVGKVITVIVAYVDDAGHGQNMTSPETLPVLTEEAAAAAEFRESLRYVANADGSVTLHWNAPDDEVTGYRILRSRHTLGEREMLVYVSDTGSTATTFTDTGLVAGVPHSYRVQAIRDGELGERTKSFKTKVFPLRKPTNSPATGAPAISGTAQVGETLTADISGIADEDGLENVTKNYLWAAIGSSGKIGAKYAYQWLVDGADSGSGDHHAGYDNTTYTLTEDDVGKAMSVRVTFVDDAGYQETLTSAATDPVAPAPQPNSPAAGAPAISGTAQVGETLTADTSGITDEDGLDDSTFTHQWVREDSVMVASAARSYTPTDGDRGKAVKVRVSFTDDAGNPETRTSANTATVEARANSPATGLPAISGTAQVGETLTADITDIADTDGLTNVSYDYQWLADDAEIAGATGSTYTPVDGDEGKVIKVRVRFADDAGNPETRTSAATAAVAAMPNSPATGAPFISGMARENHVLRAHTSGIADADGLTNVSFAYQWLADDAKIAGANGLTYTLTDSEESKAIKVQVSFTDDAGYTESLRSSSTATVQAASQCSGTGTVPTPTSIEVEAVPIVVESTNDKYYVLYVRHELDADTTVEIPVSVTLGQAGTTTLTEQLSALPAERYRVDEFLIAEPGDLDGDCIDDITELGDPAGMNPRNPAPAVEPVDGVVAIPDRETFEALSYQGRRVVIDKHLRGLEFVKFYLFRMDTDRPVVYFMNTETHRAHTWFGYVIGLWDNPLWLQGAMRGEIVYHPNVVAPDGSLGVYRFEFEPQDAYSFEAVAYAYEVLAASMPLLDDNFAYYPMPARALPLYHEERALFDDSRVNVLLEEDIFPDVDFISLNKAEGYGFLRVMALEERPNPRDVVIYETLPNELSRVAGIITTVPQTPLSHVNLRAVQDGVPNAFIRDALDDDDIDDLIDSYVHYTVAGDGWTLRAATPAEVDAHYAASRPAQTQTPERDLAVTQITALSDIGFDDWTAFGVKAANVAVLGTLGFGDGTVPDGFAVPFHFYDEFMRHNEFYDKIEEMLADTDFQSDFDTQESELKKLRKKIKKGETPEWIIEALEDMHATYPDGQSLRYRSSTNNEDLPGFSGAGLYDSKTQDPDETAEDGIDKSIKGVWASMWNFRAFTERELHRIDHLAAAMGVLVHPNYSDELANGVAVSFDPFGRRNGSYYVNTQLGEDLVTNPEAHSVPEEMLLHPDGTYTVTARSNQVPAGQLLMSDAQLGQLRRHLEAIHDEFEELYKPCSGEPFAMEIEFKITSENILAIKQARPWVFNVPSSESAGDNSATGAPRISGTAQVGETLTADTSCIKDPDGLENATFSYQWQADGTAIQDATDATYTLVEVDEGKAIRVQVSFTDDAGDDETLTSAPTAAVAASPNTPATGLPTISGTAQVGETLTAGITGIADADGLSGETFTYQWVSSDGTTDTDIENATGSTYKLVAADQGKAIKVRVTFTDGGGNEETMTSAPTAPVWGDGPPGAPRNLTATPGNKEVTLSWDPPADNGNAPATRYRIEWRIDGKDYSSSQWGTSRSTTYTTNDQANLANGVKYFFRVKAENGNGNSYGPYGPASDEVSATPTSGSAVDLDTPVLSNTENLHHRMVKLDWQDIEDAGWYVVQYYHLEGGEWLDLPAEGVGITFHGSSAVVSNLHGLSWLRVGAASCAGASEWSQIEELYGTNASDWEGVPVPEVEEGDEIEPCPVVLGTPVLSEPEYLHHGMVQLDWQDIEDAGWYVVQYYHLEGGEWLDLPAEGVDIAFHGSSAVVSNLHGLSWLRVGAASCDGASEWSQIEQLFGTNASDWEGVPVPELEEGDEIEPCSEDADTPDNSPATGAPAISGTAQVGETLTADTSGIADADGLSNVQYEYQWLADDADIAGATNATYTLTDSDEGKAVKIKVSFTDDEGNNETLTSVATAAVTAAPADNSPATGAPTISGTAQVGETLTANTSGIADADGLSNVQYEYQWLADDTDISGATNATYTLADTDEGKAITVQVSFTDDADNEETLTSAATAAVAGAQPTEPPAKPRKLSATATHDSVTLTWDDPGDDSITGYVILRRIPGVDPQGHFNELVANTGTAATTYTDNTVAAETRYTYRIKAINGAGTSERSRWFHIDTPAAPVPDQPTGLEATESDGQVVLTWDDPSDDSITGYVILRRVRVNDTGGDFSVLVADTGSAATTYTDDTVAANTTYTYRIKAINEYGVSERSRWSHIDIPEAP